MHNNLTLRFTAVLLVLLFLATLSVADHVTGDEGGVMAAQIEEALRLGKNPADIPGLVVQHGAVVTNRMTTSRHFQPAPVPTPAPTPEELAIAYAGNTGSTYYVVTNGIGAAAVVVWGGELVVFDGKVYLFTGGSIMFPDNSAPIYVASVIAGSLGTDLTQVYP